jgi:N-acetyl-anhydromuramyl-L-alanine amidase AmpD
MKSQTMRCFAIVCSVVFCTTACQQLPIVKAPSQNFNERVNHLVIHFTSENFQESLNILTQSETRPVSAHYLLPDPMDATYDLSELKIFALVPPQFRAWHAGNSYWAGKRGLNDQSIGIEIVNESRCLDDIATLANQPAFKDRCRFEAFAPEQIALLIALIKEILKDFPDISPHAIIGHADIAPSRKIDPGPLFPWRQLYGEGIGAWFDENRVQTLIPWLETHPIPLETQQRLLNHYGYDLDVTGTEDTQSQLAVRAFQMHFRPNNYSGFFDTETLARLISLIERYRPEGLTLISDLPEAIALHRALP